MEHKEAAGALFGLGAALGAAVSLFFYSGQPATFGALALGWRPEATAAAAPFEFEAAFGVLRGFSREPSSSLLEGSLTLASISFCCFSFWAEVKFLDACATIKKWA
jgi:glutathione S-transferase